MSRHRVLPQASGGVSGSETSNRSVKAGGVAYQPEFLLDCVLLCDNLREPSTLKDSVKRLWWVAGREGETTV